MLRRSVCHLRFAVRTSSEARAFHKGLGCYAELLARRKSLAEAAGPTGRILRYLGLR